MGRPYPTPPARTAIQPGAAKLDRSTDQTTVARARPAPIPTNPRHQIAHSSAIQWVSWAKRKYSLVNRHADIEQLAKR